MANATLAIAAASRSLATDLRVWVLSAPWLQRGLHCHGYAFGALPVCNSDSGDQDLPPKTQRTPARPGSPPKPCTAKQLKQGMTNDINGNCMPKEQGPTSA